MSMLDIAKVLKARMGAEARKVPVREIPNWVVRVVALFDGRLRQLLPMLGTIRRPKSPYPSAWKSSTARRTSSRLQRTFLASVSSTTTARSSAKTNQSRFTFRAPSAKYSLAIELGRHSRTSSTTSEAGSRGRVRSHRSVSSPDIIRDSWPRSRNHADIPLVASSLAFVQSSSSRR